MSSSRTRRLKDSSERVLQRVSGSLSRGARQVSLESDEWFLTAVAGLGKGARKTKLAIDGIGRSVLGQSRKLRPKWTIKQTPRERIRELLSREAKRSKLALGNEFEAFSDQIATIVELVLLGKVSLDDIAFERDERAQRLTPADAS
jgi:hypothetical protein